MQWFRFYSEALYDPKVQKLSPTMFKHWVNILCLANLHEPRGQLPPATDVAYALRMAEGRACELLDELLAMKLLDVDDEGNLSPHNWKNRQPDSDDAKTRMRRRRSEHVPNNDRTTTEHVRARGEESRKEEKREEETQSRGEARVPALNDPPSLPQLKNEWENRIGFLSPADSDSFRDYAALVPHAWFMAAIDDTTKSKRPSWGYCMGILKSCVEEQRPPTSIRREVVAATAPKSRIYDS